MSGRGEVVLKLLERLHGSLGDVEAYVGFLEALQHAISPDCRVIHGTHRLDGRPGVLASPAFGVIAADLGEFLGEFDHPAASDFPAGAVLPVPAESRFYRSRFFREILAPAGVCPGPGLAVVLERSPAQVNSTNFVLPGAPGWAPTPDDRALLEQLAPHMVIARRLHFRLAEQQHEEEALVSAFDRLVLGVVFTDESGRISYANRSASELIGHPPGFSEPDAVLDDHARAWRELLASRPEQGPFVHAPDDGRPIQVLHAPLDWGKRQTLAAARFAHAHFIADPTQSSDDPVQMLGELFGLTKSEARLATLLLADCSLQEAAARLGITETTARGVLKSIFAKTQTNRQADLLRMLLRGPSGQLRTSGSPAPGKTTGGAPTRKRPRRTPG
jgi:DNA-binding CsgD family transcriptional regulator